MPRRGAAPRRQLMPDPVYKSVLVTQVTNKVLMHGQEVHGRAIVYDALDIVGEKTDGDALAALKRAVDNVKPQLEVKSRRVGGATYQVPVEVRAQPGHHARHPVDRRLRPRPSRAHHGRAPCRRAPRCQQRHRQLGQAQGRHAQDGRVQQGLRPLPLVAPDHLGGAPPGARSPQTTGLHGSVVAMSCDRIVDRSHRARTKR